jgi:hypothetical protein
VLEARILLGETSVVAIIDIAIVVLAILITVTTVAAVVPVGAGEEGFNWLNTVLYSANISNSNTIEQ